MSSVSGERSTGSIETINVLLQDEAYLAQISLDPGASRRTRVRADEDPHGRERVRYVDQGTDTRQAGSMTEADKTHTTSPAEVKGEFVGNQVPPDGKLRRTG